MTEQADFVVIGGGIAGLRAMATLAGAGRTLLLTKAGPEESNTGYAQGGIAAAIGPDDSPELHLADTLAAGAGLCDRGAVDVLVHEGPRYVRELIAWGARFDLNANGEPALAREGAHSVHRVLHAHDATGREIARTLWRHVAPARDVTVLHDARAIALLVEDGACTGVRYVDSAGRPDLVRARAVLLATGGAGCVFAQTTNPPIATGDGVAMAFRAGARVSDLEFVQFHPTVLDVPTGPRFLLSEALRGEGARLVNADGEPFMTRYDPAGDLAARDVVATSMVRERARTGRPVFLSLAHLDASHMLARFPTIAVACAAAGLDLARDPLPVSPAAHYMCGGVDTDLDGRTSVPGLFAAGEVACTGVHGANRLASNSLLEGLVFGARAAAAMLQPAGVPRLREVARTEAAVRPSPAPSTDTLDIPARMWADVGLIRDASGLAAAAADIGAVSARFEQDLDTCRDLGTWRAASVALVGWLIARAALRRTESRGGHRRSDFTDRDDVHWRIHVADGRPSEADDQTQEGRTSVPPTR